MGLIVESLLDSMTISVRPARLAILGAVFVLLAIACVNLSNLLLARTLARRAELAVPDRARRRSAQLLRQLVTESVVITLAGGLAGIGVAVAMEAGALESLAPPSLERAGAFRIDVSRAFALALIVSTLVGLVAGVLPGLSGIRHGTYTAVRAGSRATDSQHRVTRRALVVTQVALAFVLPTSAGLLFRSVEKLLATEPGFDAERVLTMQVCRHRPALRLLRRARAVLRTGARRRARRARCRGRRIHEPIAAQPRFGLLWRGVRVGRARRPGTRVARFATS